MSVCVYNIILEGGNTGVFERNGISDVFLGRGIDHVSDWEPLDGFVLGHQPTAVDADDGLNVTSVLLASSVVSSLTRHTLFSLLSNFIRYKTYLYINDIIYYVLSLYYISIDWV